MVFPHFTDLYDSKPVYFGSVLMLDPRETYQKYERRSPQPEFGRIACEYRRDPAPNPHQQPPPRLACEYRRDPEDQRYYRPGTTTVTSYLPETNKPKFPAGLIIAIAICIPILLVIILFGAVWLQEVGIL